MSQTHVNPCEHCSAIVHSLQRKIQELEGLSNTDVLTDLPNRRSFNNAFEKVVALARRTQRPLTVAFLDVDNFKTVNDTYGHNAGDVVLQTLAQILKKSIRTEDLVSRIGGEEFVMILIDTDLEHAQKYLERLRAKIEQDLKVVLSNKATIHVTVSFGASQLDIAEVASVLLERVDQALYEAKRSGRNRVVTAPIPLTKTSV